MPSTTIPYARNVIRRALIGIVDPEPTGAEINALWQFFDSSCAYCGRTIDRSRRAGHVDHLVSMSVGGANHVSNRVLSCATCNGDEKRDKDWREFLREKAIDDATYSDRSGLIEDWRAACGTPPQSKADPDYVEHQVASVRAAFDVAVARLRDANTRK